MSNTTTIPQEYSIELDVFVCAKHELKEEDVVDKIVSAFADQDRISVVVAPLQQTIQQDCEQRDKRIKELEEERDKLRKEIDGILNIIKHRYD